MNKEVAGLIFVFALVLTLAPGVEAVDTEITIKTVPFGNVNLNILDSDIEGVSVIEKFNGNANNYGDIVFIYKDSEDEFDVSVYVKRNDQKVIYEKYADFVAGEPIYIEAAPEGTKLYYAPENETDVNETDENTTGINGTTENKTVEVVLEPQEEVEDTTQETTSGITGAVTSEEKDSEGVFSNKLLYFVLGFLVLGIVIFTGALKMKSLRRFREEQPEKEVKIKKLSEKLKEIKEEKKEASSGAYQKAIEEAEAKIKQAQKEINKLKNAEKIEEIKKRMEKDKEELEKLSTSDD